jgi:dipeptidyl aminopeptidase/acylaminoacyl peptidase
VLITHGLSDLRVHWQQSVLLHRMLKDRGVKSRLALYPGLGHRLDQPEPSVQWWKAALCWLEENGVPPGGKLPSDTGYQG